MADQQFPPELMARLAQGEQAPPNGGPQPASDPREEVDPASVSNKLLIAVGNMADKASLAMDTRESSEAAKAALAFAQALVILDPNLGQDGVPLDHALALEAQRGENQRQARAAAPEPARGTKPRA